MYLPLRNGLMNGGRKMRVISRLIDAIVDLSYQTLFLLWVFLAAIVGLVYFFLSSVPGHGPKQLEGMDAATRFLDSLYFSFITATSTGYGDITPLGFSKVLTVVQSILALFLFAVFVTKLVSRRQDIALQQIHKLVFEDAFHNIREGFHIVRKDFDRVIARANMNHRLEEGDWEDLATAYRQAQSFLRRVLDFYEPENRLYQIDVRREELLHDGVRRTLIRLRHLLGILQSKHIHWIENNQSLEELREFLQLMQVTVHSWQRNSPHGRHQAFEELLALREEIHRSIDAEVIKRRSSIPPPP